jgi:sugar/nucleoside kinase (ribokinase family)
MRVEAVGDPWTVDDMRGWARDALGRADWVHAAPLLRSDFSPATLGELARGRRVSFDGQGLVRRPEVGPLRLDAEFDPDVLRNVSILKLAEEEARVLVGELDAASLAELGVAEVVVTLGSRGSLVLAGGRLERVPARPFKGRVDPTGAGDAFAAAYLAGRASGQSPVASARRATALVGGLLGGRTR